MGTGADKQRTRNAEATWPQGITQQGLAGRLNLMHGAGTFSKYLGTLKSNGLIKVMPAGIYAAEMLFPK